ncbi:MAG TPA: hydrogenase maturation protease [Bryobacteraceae bacterium]|nr:hydrogenase maturation protease [Bryobacteraceae bacterium]
MAAFTAREPAPLRLLALGNEILGDDAFAILVARRVAELVPDRIDVVCSSAAGFHLLDDVIGAARLLVVDIVQTGRAPAGTVYVVREHDVHVVSGSSPHYTGLFEMLAVARQLCLEAPLEVLILAVEAADCLTVGGGMHEAVRAAIPQVADLIATATESADPLAAIEMQLKNVD